MVILQDLALKQPLGGSPPFSPHTLTSVLNHSLYIQCTYHIYTGAKIFVYVSSSQMCELLKSRKNKCLIHP